MNLKNKQDCKYNFQKNKYTGKKDCINCVFKNSCQNGILIK